jgi:hypothetical protein
MASNHLLTRPSREFFRHQAGITAGNHRFVVGSKAIGRCARKSTRRTIHSPSMGRGRSVSKDESSTIYRSRYQHSP